ncbi:unnamed protein product [Paramecium octaurelia]|uniref:Uncharacterized protein n=1 Tax=Paramecium octaurelia TaxID=43137 RepID=A0A8S1X721_PAROT|nr:unnamed protein product [Paramecium octaurelia]
MQKNHNSGNLNKINSYHNQNDDEEDCQDLFGEISEVLSLKCDENFNLQQMQDDKGFYQSNNSILINLNEGIKNIQANYPLKINEFSQQKIRKDFNLYKNPKTDDASKMHRQIKSRIYKQYISRRTKMKTK